MTGDSIDELKAEEVSKDQDTNLKVEKMGFIYKE